MSKALDVRTFSKVRMLTPEVAGQLNWFHWAWLFQETRCLMKNDDHGPQGVNPPIIPYVPVKRGIVYQGTRETGSYNHHSQLAKFKGKYWFAFSNGIRDEEAEGQRIRISNSDDGVNWSDAVTVIGGEPGTTIVHNCVALYVEKDAMYIVDWREESLRDAESVGMRRIVPESNQLNLLKSTDGKTWNQISSWDPNIRVIFEAPRLTAEGRLMCICSTVDNGAAFMMWPGDKIEEKPEIITPPQNPDASFPYGEGTWYQLDDGRIIVFWRDEAGSCRAYVNYSEDGGKTWTPPMISDIPDSMSRLYAGRLTDGRYYLTNNAFPTLLNRMHLTLMLSDDGIEFNKVYLIVDDPTSQRLKGLLKCDGYQYPVGLVDGNKLIIGHSVNKEDIWCEVIDATKI